MSTRNSNQNVIAALIVAILALAGLNIYQYINRNALVETNKQQETEMVAMEKAKTELDKQYYETLSELEEMKSDNVELNEMIDEQKEELTKQKNRIGVLLKDSKNLSRVRKELDKMKEESAQYVAEINALREENDQLNASNRILSEEKTVLTDSLVREQAAKEALSSEKDLLSEANEKLSTEKETLSRKVNMASTIEVKDLVVKGYKVSESGKEARRRQAENINLLRICFDLTKNELAEAGTEGFHIRILNPIGETLAVDRLGSGIMTGGEKGEQMRYTTFTEVQYNHKEKEVCTDWKPGNDFMSGQHTLEVYNKGFLAGTTKFKLK